MTGIFQLPLSGSPVFVHSVGPTLQSNFQLPLSGSPIWLKSEWISYPPYSLSTPSLGITVHFVVFPYSSAAIALSTPSLGITALEELVRPVLFAAFNSLSRDHSLIDLGLIEDLVLLLSTPSLGITDGGRRRSIC